MAWPFSRLTTYLFQSLPAVKSGDLNAIQDAIGALFGGTLSIKSLWIDGVGNAASAVAAGTLRAVSAIIDNGLTVTVGNIAATAGSISAGGTISATGSSFAAHVNSSNEFYTAATKSGAAANGAAAPLTNTVLVGERWNEGAVLGHAWVQGGGAGVFHLVRGYNIYNVVRSAQGHYQVLINTVAANSVYAVATPLASFPGGAGNYYVCGCVATLNTGGHSMIDVYISDKAGNLQDIDFAIWIFGG
jgi:hypothetical protein